MRRAPCAVRSVLRRAPDLSHTWCDSLLHSVKRTVAPFQVHTKRCRAAARARIALTPRAAHVCRAAARARRSAHHGAGGRRAGTARVRRRAAVSAQQFDGRARQWQRRHAARPRLARLVYGCARNGAAGRAVHLLETRRMRARSAS
ncbi:hypothetical protein FGB62_217g01 [Gracilaria domingensis]|nr:hypothetical protein FGB62_217g01 [Gracilaria domingensis]